MDSLDMYMVIRIQLDVSKQFILSFPIDLFFPLTTQMTQNKFVEKFTLQEKEAVTKLKEKLPEVLKTALGSEEPYTLWDVALDKDSNDERLNVLLIKFLRAR